MKIPPSPRIKTEGASMYTGIPTATLRYWRHVGIGPASYALGGSVFYDVADLDAWIAESKAATARGGVTKALSA